METLQKLSIPIAIVIAGGLIAGSVFYVNRNAGSTPPPSGGVVAENIRGVQADDHTLGNPDAPVVLVEFSDPECPFCKQFHQTLHRLMTDYGPSGDVVWVYRHFPLSQLHPKAPKEAEALECAAAQGGNDMFWKYTDLLYETTNSNNSLDDGIYNTPANPPIDPTTGKPYYTQHEPRSDTDAGMLSDMAKELGLDVAAFEQCLADGTYADRIEKDWNEAVAAGGQGTPHSILIAPDGSQIPIEGSQSYEVVKGMIDSLL